MRQQAGKDLSPEFAAAQRLQGSPIKSAGCWAAGHIWVVAAGIRVDNACVTRSITLHIQHHAFVVRAQQLPEHFQEPKLCLVPKVFRPCQLFTNQVLALRKSTLRTATASCIRQCRPMQRSDMDKLMQAELAGLYTNEEKNTFGVLPTCRQATSGPAMLTYNKAWDGHSRQKQPQIVQCT